MKKYSYVGIVNHIRLISSFPDLLVRFTLHTKQDTINCVVARRKLANLMLFLEEDTFELAVFGHYNSRNQLVIEKFIVRNPTPFIREFVMKTLKTIA